MAPVPDDNVSPPRPTELDPDVREQVAEMIGMDAAFYPWAVAEFERGLIRERVKEGMTNAKRKGARIGRPPAAARPAVARQLPAVAAAVAAGTLSKRQAARRLGVGAPTLDRAPDEQQR